MSTFSQGHMRQEGFHLENNSNHIPHTPEQQFDFRTTMDFTDELASLMGAASPQHPGHSHERSTHSPVDNQAQGESTSYRTHNIFDMGVATPNNFNSTVPALNSSMRYEPHPDPPSPGRSQSRSRSRPPASGGGSVGPTRNTRSRRNNSISSTSPPPLPIGSGAGRPQAIVIPGVRHNGNANGLSSPLSSSAHSTSGGWFAGSAASPASEFTLPTPDSLHQHHHSLHTLHPTSTSQQHHYGSYNSQGTGSFNMMGFANGYEMSMSPHENPHHYHTQPAQHQIHNNSSTSLPVTSSVHSNIHHRSSSSTAAPVPSSNSQALSPQEKQAMAASEKRRRRRESHNAVERRRRDNINEKISELATLIPECLLEGGTLPPPSNNANGPPTLLPANDPSTNGDSPASPSEPPLSALSPIDNEGTADLWTIAMKKEDLGAGVSIPEEPASPGANGAGGVVKANKGMILRKSVEYIRYLQQLVSAQGVRNRELEAELRVYKENDPNATLTPSPSANSDFSLMFGGAGYAGSTRILNTMPEETSGQAEKGMMSPISQGSGSTPLSDDDDDFENEEMGPKRTTKTTKERRLSVSSMELRGRRGRAKRGSFSEGNGVKKATRRGAEEDVVMGGDDS